MTSRLPEVVARTARPEGPSQALKIVPLANLAKMTSMMKRIGWRFSGPKPPRTRHSPSFEVRIRSIASAPWLPTVRVAVRPAQVVLNGMPLAAVAAVALEEAAGAEARRPVVPGPQAAVASFVELGGPSNLAGNSDREPEPARYPCRFPSPAQLPLRSPEVVEVPNPRAVKVPAAVRSPVGEVLRALLPIPEKAMAVEKAALIIPSPRPESRGSFRE